MAIYGGNQPAYLRLLYLSERRRFASEMDGDKKDHHTGRS